MTERQPERDNIAFTCPHCEVYSRQRWAYLYHQPEGLIHDQIPGDWATSTCDSCEGVAMWRGSNLVWPKNRIGPLSHADMPPNVRVLFDEAREIAPLSSRSAAGLLRLALQMLIDEVEPGPGSINGQIGKLVQRGLDVQVQQAMDVVRVVGNNAVHPGQIDLEAGTDLIPALFTLINLVVEQVISRPKHVAALYEALPEASRSAVERRDGTSSTNPQ